MRLVSGILAAVILAAAVPPAWAVCIIRGGVRNCYQEPRPWKTAEGPEQESPAVAPISELKTIVLQPSASGDNAWVLTPESGDGAVAARSINISAPACEPGLSC
ncbi:hypothetical protein [Dongia sp. agr-C8]